MKKFYFFLSMLIAAMTVSAATITDAITPGDFRQGTTTTYVDLGDFTAPKSGNTYHAFAAIAQSGSDYVFGVRPAGSNTGFVVTDAKAGPVRRVYFSWPGTINGYQINVYGSDEPFTIADMYKEEGVTLLGTVTKDGSNDTAFGMLEVSSEYNFKYVGLRPTGSAMFEYLKVIYFDYDEPVVEPTTATVTAVLGPNTRKYTIFDYDASSPKYLTIEGAGESKSQEYNIGERMYVKVFAQESEGALLSKVTVNGVEYPAAVGKEDYSFFFTLEGDTEIYAEASAPSKCSFNITIEGDGYVTLLDDQYNFYEGTSYEFNEGTGLILSPVAGDNSVIESFTINGVEATDENGETAAGKKTIMFEYTIESDTEVKAVFKSEKEPEPTDYCNNYEGMTSSHTSRYLGTVTLTSGDETLTVTAQGKINSDIYVDKTDEVFEITPGSSIDIKCTGAGEWMHGYAWVDWNRDLVFTPEIGDDHAVTPGSELVAFNYYNGYDSNGSSAAENSNGYQANLTFNVPEDITYGDYRFRYIIAWDNINPCGPELTDKDELRTTGGCILDVTLRYSERDENAIEVIEAAGEVAPVYYNLQGVRVANPAEGVYIKVAGDKAEKVYLSK